MNSKTNVTRPGQKPAITSPDGFLAETRIVPGKEKKERLLDEDERDNREDPDMVMGTDADITQDEIEMLENANDYMPTTDEEQLQQASLDNTDDDGDLLNESGFGQDRSGADLDIPGASDDDMDEDIGEEDEENNSYSLGGDDHNELDEKTS